MTDWEYFAIVNAPRDSIANPRGIFRQEKASQVPLGEVLRRNGQWFRSDLPYRHFLGKSLDDELHPIDRSAAVRFVEEQHRLGNLESIPDDLVEP